MLTMTNLLSIVIYFLSIVPHDWFIGALASWLGCLDIALLGSFVFFDRTLYSHIACQPPHRGIGTGEFKVGG